MPRYHVLHETHYEYGSAVSISQQQLHLEPRAVPWQHCLSHRLECEPAPGWEKQGADAFGNPMRWLHFDVPHDHLSVVSEMIVEVDSHNANRDLTASVSWDTLRDRLTYDAGAMQPEDFNAASVLFESPYVRIKRDIGAYAKDCFVPGESLLLCAERLMQKIYREFEFDTEATTIATPVIDVLQRRRGVCQDFAHMMLACLRVMGLPARYVSGYLLTQPPPGKPRMIGADASHAWVSVYAPQPDGSVEWVDFDPTNNLLPDLEHITLAWGRDFGDVSPMRGIILGGGAHEPEVAVTVTPLEGKQLRA
ncbi:MAG TPA: transglutaminase family protein [Rhodocyclaceae bacterium]|nr:transglutaminase family protein [Rhodocyclaceae bacterium]